MFNFYITDAIYQIQTGLERPVHPPKSTFLLWRNSQWFATLRESTIYYSLNTKKWTRFTGQNRKTRLWLIARLPKNVHRSLSLKLEECTHQISPNPQHHRGNPKTTQFHPQRQQQDAQTAGNNLLSTTVLTALYLIVSSMSDTPSIALVKPMAPSKKRRRGKSKKAAVSKQTIQQNIHLEPETSHHIEPGMSNEFESFYSSSQV